MVLPGRNPAAIDWLKESDGGSELPGFLSIRPQAYLVQQAFAAAASIACFSTSSLPRKLILRAPQLKRGVA
jgi:hypothetical protein